MDRNLIITTIALTFLSLSPAIAYACEANFCTPFGCTRTSDCQNACLEGYFYYGEKLCTSTCAFEYKMDYSKFCKYQYRVCADSDTCDGYPLDGAHVKSCGAECDQETDYYPDGSTCYYGCNLEECGYDYNCQLESYCDGTVRYYEGGCASDGCSFESQDCSELPNEVSCSGAGTDTLSKMERGYGCMFGQCELVVGGGFTITCDAEREFQTVECGGTDYYCYYDSGYVWDDSYPDVETDCTDDHDNDHDGFTDLDDTDCYVCEPGEQRSCALQQGVCSGSSQTCTEEGQWPGCDYTHVLGYEEVEQNCDGLDNDCDGEVDEGCECSSGIDCDDSNMCTIGSCTEGECTYENVEDGTVCDDSDSSTVNDVCMVGVCIGETDDDGDGYGSDDCDDSDPLVNPGAEEVCGDDVDNNCDGQVDEGCAECAVSEDCTSDNVCQIAECVDASCVFSNAEDGTTCDDGDENTINDSCSSGVCTGYTDEDDDGHDSSEDCDDTNPNVYPGAPEVCEDGIDNDCDGLTDCDDNNCNENPTCAAPYVPTGGGGFIGFSGGSIINEVVCGDGTCEYGEDCSNCPSDCLESGEVCCDQITYIGSCCVDADCGEGFECTLSKMCQTLPVKNDMPINDGGPSYCQEDWICSDWTSCDQGVHTRTCVTTDTCESIESKPMEIEECTPEDVSPITGLFTLVTSPYSVAFMGGLLLLLIMFLIRRKRKK